MKKNQFIVILVIITLIFLLVIFTLLRKEKPLEEEIIREEPITIEDFLGSPIITGNFVELDIKNDTLYLETYDFDQRQDIIFSVEITEKTILKKTSREVEELLIIKENYSEALNFLSQGTPLKVFVQDPLKERPEAFVVEIDVDFPLFFELPETDAL